ncbi:hypothetical protein OPT61_g10384 [Boeremia exigua]|uniref:Uncharacterized protein n=1 Tax=Boeremia exigua TaxID=749465 RepID=A0ACC2HPU8_9PLEO|nr:hypothetical protein OPT61_g10384 [Boeremia exigua]
MEVSGVAAGRDRGGEGAGQAGRGQGCRGQGHGGDCGSAGRRGRVAGRRAAARLCVDLGARGSAGRPSRSSSSCLVAVSPGPASAWRRSGSSPSSAGASSGGAATSEPGGEAAALASCTATQISMRFDPSA